MKKISVLLLGLIVMFFAFTASVSAAEPVENQSELEDVLKVVEKANADIDKKIETAIQQANFATGVADQLKQHLNNSQYLSADQKAVLTEQINASLERKLESIRVNLIQETDAIVAHAKEYGEQRGYVVICEYVPVVIGGVEILIDPLRVGL